MKRGHIPIGEKMNRLTAIADLGLRQEPACRNRWLLCRCDCGAEIEVSMNNFKSGNTRSCGCLNREVMQARARKNAENNRKYDVPDLIGKTYRGGVVLSDGAPYFYHNRKIPRVKTRCHCGTEYETGLYPLVSGHTKSCGCQQRKAAAEATRKAMTRHGETKTSLHVLWQKMRARCNPGSTQYEWYGARGIAVCEEWNEYEVFRDWAKAHGYRRGLELDRIDNDGPYSPGNCRFIHHYENVQNSRTAKLDADKVRFIRSLQIPSAKLLAIEYGVSEYCIYCVLNRKTWRNIS